MGSESSIIPVPEHLKADLGHQAYMWYICMQNPHIIIYIQFKSIGLEKKIAQQLKALVALAEDTSSDPDPKGHHAHMPFTYMQVKHTHQISLFGWNLQLTPT